MDSSNLATWHDLTIRQLEDLVGLAYGYNIYIYGREAQIEIVESEN